MLDVLKKAGLTSWTGEVVAVGIANEAGAVAEVTGKLAQKEIDIRALYASTKVGVDAATLYLWTSNNAAAVKALV